MSTKSKRPAASQKGRRDRPGTAEEPDDRAPVDARSGSILRAAFDAFVQHGVLGATTDEIARRARVSKREIYRLFGSKEELFARLVRERATAMRRVLVLAPATDRATALETLQRFGQEFLTLLTDPTTTAVYRLAVAEVTELPEIGRELDEYGRGTVWSALAAWMEDASQRGALPVADVERAGGSFMALLMADLPVRLLLGAVKPPTAEEIERRAALAIAGFARLWLA